jgi:hypothetical protein
VPAASEGTVCFQGALASCTIFVDGVASGKTCTGLLSHSCKLALDCNSALQAEQVDPLPLPPLSSYPARLIGTDKLTSGAWRGRYGRDGYVLFSYSAAGADVTALPPYVARVAMAPYAAGRTATLARNTADPRALAPPAGGLGSIGIRATQIPSGLFLTRGPYLLTVAACLETIVVDIILSVPRPFQVRDIPFILTPGRSLCISATGCALGPAK